MTQEQGAENITELPKSSEEILINYAQSLGFVETEEMQLLRQKTATLDREEEEFEEEFIRQLNEYQALASPEIKKIQDQDPYSKAQIGLSVATATLDYSAGRFQRYRQAMEDAIDYASNMRFDEISDRLKEIQLEIFKEDFRRGLGDLFGYLEVAPEEPIPPDPSSMGFDDRTLEDITDTERAELKRILFEELGVDPNNNKDSLVRSYKVEALNIQVFRTNREDEGIFLQEILYPDGEKRWVVGPDRNI